MFPYENLEVYKKAFAANKRVYDFLKNNKNLPQYLKNQWGRSSLSIMLNIAEGSGRSTNRDRKSFLVNSRGSVFECASIIDFISDQNEIPREIAIEIQSGYEEISRMLFAMIKNLEK